MNEARDELKSVVAWISARTDGMRLPTDRRARLAIGCLDLAIEQQAGISALVERPLWGPVFALLRCMFDAFIRGVWLARCATEDDLDSFELAGLRDIPFADLMVDVERALGDSRGILSKLAKSSWAMFSDFTHTGVEYVRRTNGATHGPTDGAKNYPPAETDQALRLATALGLLAATELADLSGHRDVALACKAHAAQFAGPPPEARAPPLKATRLARTDSV